MKMPPNSYDVSLPKSPKKNGQNYDVAVIDLPKRSIENEDRVVSYEVALKEIGKLSWNLSWELNYVILIFLCRFRKGSNTADIRHSVDFDAIT